MIKSSHPSSNIVAIIFGVGFAIYLIYLCTVLTNSEPSKISDYKIDFLLNQQEFRMDQNQNPRKNILRVISKPSCGRFPMLADLNITDNYWQVTNTSNGTFYLFNAYFDDREALKNVSVVRILSLITRIKPVVKTHCQFWFEGIKEAVIVEVDEYRMLWRDGWGDNKNGAGKNYLKDKFFC